MGSSLGLINIAIAASVIPRHALAEDLVSHDTHPTALLIVCSTLPSNTKGMHLVTDAVVRECQEGLKNVDVGIFTLCCLHTSAGLTVRHTLVR